MTPKEYDKELTALAKLYTKAIMASDIETAKDCWVKLDELNKKYFNKETA
jgi:hypothetical protein